jgi:hypothetical protein
MTWTLVAAATRSKQEPQQSVVSPRGQSGDAHQVVGGSDKVASRASACQVERLRAGRFCAARGTHRTGGDGLQVGERMLWSDASEIPLHHESVAFRAVQHLPGASRGDHLRVIVFEASPDPADSNCVDGMAEARWGHGFELSLAMLIPCAVLLAAGKVFEPLEG